MKKLFLTALLLLNVMPILALADSPATGPYGNYNTLPQNSLGGIQSAVNGGTPAQFCSGRTCTYTPLEPLPGQPATGSLTFGQYIGNIFKITVVLGGMLAVAVIVFAGIRYMLSDVAGNKQWAKDKLVKALYALLILVGSYLLLSTINPNLTIFQSSPGSINALQKTPFISQSQGNTYTTSNTMATQADLANCQAKSTASRSCNITTNVNPWGCMDQTGVQC